MASRHFVVGVDLGQSQDHSVVAVVEIVGRRPHEEHHLVHYQQMPLGGHYSALADHLVLLRRKLGGELVSTERGAYRESKVDFVVDATGLGQVVLEMLEDRRLQPVGVTITGGQMAHRTGRHWSVPKSELADTIQVDLEQRRLKITPHVPHAGVLLDEARSFIRTVTRTTGHETFEAARGKHDDMILALGLALWYANRVVGWAQGARNVRAHWG